MSEGVPTVADLLAERRREALAELERKLSKGTGRRPAPELPVCFDCGEPAAAAVGSVGLCGPCAEGRFAAALQATPRELQPLLAAVLARAFPGAFKADGEA